MVKILSAVIELSLEGPLSLYLYGPTFISLEEILPPQGWELSISNKLSQDALNPAHGSLLRVNSPSDGIFSNYLSAISIPCPLQEALLRYARY